MARTDKAGSQQWTAVLSFLGLIALVAKVYNASPRANMHKLQNDPFKLPCSLPKLKIPLFMVFTVFHI